MFIIKNFAITEVDHTYRTNSRLTSSVCTYTLIMNGFLDRTSFPSS